MTSIAIDSLCSLSHVFGSDTMCVLGGGGNCSFKTSQVLNVKASGSKLSSLAPEDFVQMDRASLREILVLSLPGDAIAVETVGRQLLLGARVPGQTRKPSVEVLVHELMPHPFVFHAHPVLVNGMLCSTTAADTVARLFPDALYVPYCDPGVAMAKHIWLAVDELAPKLIFVQNHGLFIGADTTEEITALYNDVETTLCDVYEKAGVDQDVEIGTLDRDLVMEFAPPLRSMLGTKERRAVICSSGAFTPAAGPLTPDHLTYAGSTAITGGISETAVEVYAEMYGERPRIVSGDDQGLFAAGQTLREAELALEAALNATKVEQLTQAFGGPNFLDTEAQALVRATDGYPQREALAAQLAAKPLGGKVVLITGAAQGFGYGIAQDVAARGATVIVADLNLEGAIKAADELVNEYGPGTALAVKVNIADEDSVITMIDDVVHRCGGLDVLIANAGVLRAGSVKTLDKKDWDFVTNVNYTGYFLCVKHVAPVMAAQNLQSGRGGWMDVIQISSKSGLEGSNRNGAYAGSKFGGIGLTQSFAMELVSDCIKVNSICPGNFFDGPLWADPDNGLFVQYLRSGKVPGATTIDEVRSFYEAKVPMGRGCLPSDVSQAIEYVVKQQYETGQAVPVTGGQVMLN